MAGFRTFATGEVLTAANVNNFLMKQSVMVFDDADARTAALGAEVIEGMLTYNKDTDQLEVFDGTNFVVAAPEPPPPTPQNLVAVKSSLKTDTFSASLGGGANAIITGLTITHAVADESNKLLITATVGTSSSSSGLGDTGIAVFDGTDLLAIGDALSTFKRASAGGRTATTSNTRMSNHLSFSFVHTPGAGSKTYDVVIINTDSNTRTVQVNRPVDSGNFLPVAASSLIIQEVKV